MGVADNLLDSGLMPALTGAGVSPASTGVSNEPLVLADLDFTFVANLLSRGALIDSPLYKAFLDWLQSGVQGHQGRQRPLRR